MRRAPDGENQARRAPGHEVHWRFALRYEVPELLLALYVRDVFKLTNEGGASLPSLEPEVEANVHLLTGPARGLVEGQWDSWWAELLSAPQPAIDLPADLRSLPSLRSRPDLAEMTAAIGKAATTWISERAGESRTLREQGTMVDGGHGQLLFDIFGGIRTLEPQQFGFDVTELSVAGDASIKLSDTHFVVTRTFACHIESFELWLRNLLEERAEALRA
jgi:hypothetical protein